MTTQQRVAQMLRRRPIRVSVAINGTWSAELPDSSTIYTYEAIDLDKGCRKFLEGLVAAGVPIVDYGNHGFPHSIVVDRELTNGQRRADRVLIPWHRVHDETRALFV